MAKHVKVGSGGTITNRHNKSGTSNSGGEALKTQHRVANDGQGVPKGTPTNRHMTVKPSASSGTIGHAQPLATNKAKKELRGSDKPLKTKIKSTKPSR